MKPHLILAVLLFAVFFSYGTNSIAGESRDWTNTDGKTITAELISMSGDEITLRMGNGREYTVSLDTLIEADGEYARSWQAGQTALADAPVPVTAPLIGIPGKVLYHDDLTAIDASWSMPKGEWVAGPAGLTGAELAADDHGAVFKRAQTLGDVIIEFEFLPGETKSVSFSIDDDKDHLCRVSLSSAGFQARKDDNDHEGPDVGKPFNNVTEPLAKDEWHRVRIEVVGEEMLAQIGEEISLGSDAILSREKIKWGFTVAGPAAGFRNLTIWEASPNSEWEKEGPRLKRRLGVEE